MCIRDRYQRRVHGEGRDRINIIASNVDSLKAAKKQLMLGSIVLILLPEQAGLLKTKLTELREKSKVVCTIDHSLENDAISPPKITAIGTEESLKNFKLSVEMLLNIIQKSTEEKRRQDPPKSEDHYHEPGHRNYPQHRIHSERQNIVYRKKAQSILLNLPPTKLEKKKKKKKKKKINQRQNQTLKKNKSSKQTTTSITI
eukprot:TRINITY_DN22957_c0_g1_i3.p1 TRINITY_DN22957_c0_g1~~TRINITY_DN22957_c0_g1_i3.p1  ORF type:complete len:200 (-),score=39.78 TRINITY_DN22957_c0_g1_i3:80-679(-)